MVLRYDAYQSPNQLTSEHNEPIHTCPGGAIQFQSLSFAASLHRARPQPVQVMNDDDLFFMSDIQYSKAITMTNGDHKLLMILCQRSITRSGREHEVIVMLLHQYSMILHFTIELEFQLEKKNMYHAYINNGTVTQSTQVNLPTAMLSFAVDSIARVEFSPQ